MRPSNSPFLLLFHFDVPEQQLFFLENSRGLGENCAPFLFQRHYGQLKEELQRLSAPTSLLDARASPESTPATSTADNAAAAAVGAPGGADAAATGELTADTTPAESSVSTPAAAAASAPSGAIDADDDADVDADDDEDDDEEESASPPEEDESNVTLKQVRIDLSFTTTNNKLFFMLTNAVTHSSQCGCISDIRAGKIIQQVHKLNDMNSFPFSKF